MRGVVPLWLTIDFMDVGTTADPGSLKVRLVQPAEPLRGFISAYFDAEIDTADAVSDHSVPEWGSVRIICSGALEISQTDGTTLSVDRPFLQGPSSHPVKFTMRRCHVVGIGLFPEGFARFWNLNLAPIADRWAWVNDALGNEHAAFVQDICAAKTTEERFAIADAHFLRLLQETRSRFDTDLVVTLHRHLNDPEMSRIEDIAAAMNVSTSTIAGLCKKRFGFPPKQLLRRQRFLRMLEALHARPYSEWPHFVDPQYSDQSHMIRDFKYFMGMSPSQYLALPRPIQQASATQRRQAVGRALQGLE